MKKEYYVAAVQKSKLNDGIPGELFGIANLFRMTCQNIKTVELLAKQDPQSSYRIKEVDSAELGEDSLQMRILTYTLSMSNVS